MPHELIEYIGWLGLGLLLIAWLPQTWATIKAGSTPLNAGFILLYFSSSAILAIYSWLEANTVFTVLNTLLTLGSGVNLYYRFFPTKRPAM